MLLKLELQNFYSVRDRHELDLRIPLTTPRQGRFLAAPFDESVRVPSTIAIFGANASGKTTILRALAFIEAFVTRSFDIYDPGDAISISSFASEATEHGASEIAVEFAPALGTPAEGLAAVYRYEIGIQHTDVSNFVRFERLRHSDDGKSFTLLFEVQRPSEAEAIVRAHKDFQLPPRDPRRNVRSNVSLISSLIQFDHPVAKTLQTVFDWSFGSNVVGSKYQLPEENVTEFLKSSPRALDILNTKLRMIDVGIEDVRLMEVEGKTMPLFRHSGLNGLQTLYFESQGTKSFYCLFPHLAHSLGYGATASLDEVDSDLHPALVTEVMRWFQDPSENVRRAQLITSCNSPSVLNELEKEEVWLTEKGADGATTIIPLSDIAGVRRDTNLYRKYLSGSFGAVPRFG
jgi:hypothetical protein